MRRGQAPGWWQRLQVALPQWSPPVQRVGYGTRRRNDRARAPAVEPQQFEGVEQPGRDLRPVLRPAAMEPADAAG
jgi:hypothetical protein